MNDTELRELDAWIAVNVMRWIPVRGDYWNGAVCPGKFNCAIDEADGWAYEYNGGVSVGNKGKTYCSTETYQWRPHDDPAAAMQALMKYFELDPNDCLPALHNFLCKKQFSERTLTPEKICLFIKWHYQKYHQP